MNYITYKEYFFGPSAYSINFKLQATVINQGSGRYTVTVSKCFIILIALTGKKNIGVQLSNSWMLIYT